MSDTSDVLVTREHAVLHLRFNRPSRKNSLTSPMYALLAEALEASATDDSVRVVTLGGNRDVFTAGNDIGEFADPGVVSPDSPVFRFMRALARFPKPLVAGVCGPAVGIGLTMMLHCDLVLAGTNAVFSAPFVDLGLCPEAGSSLLLARVVGQARAADILLNGKRLNADQALCAGLVAATLEPDQVELELAAAAAKLSRKPLAALVETKRLMKGAASDSVIDRINEEARAFCRLVTGRAAKEAMNAFIEKRRPDFTGL